MALIVGTISQAKAQLSMLIERVQAGEQVIIGKAGRPVAILSPYAAAPRARTPGALRGEIQIADDFDQLPRDIAKAFGADPDGTSPS